MSPLEKEAWMSQAVNMPNDERGRHVDDRPAVETSGPATTADDTAVAPDRREVVSREKDAFGGMKLGSCFFGWLTASGTAVLLAALVTGIGAALGLSREVETAGTSAAQAESVGLIGGIIL